ncbi:hypothetical protein EDC01DRAFT_402608 [Geopyxis carbonaria]|nr:hypothetical protein EDC01DRAFT_402608 [Geopyxis carbonaria]
MVVMFRNTGLIAITRVDIIIRSRRILFYHNKHGTASATLQNKPHHYSCENHYSCKINLNSREHKHLCPHPPPPLLLPLLPLPPPPPPLRSSPSTTSQSIHHAQLLPYSIRWKRPEIGHPSRARAGAFVGKHLHLFPPPPPPPGTPPLSSTPSA